MKQFPFSLELFISLLICPTLRNQASALASICDLSRPECMPLIGLKAKEPNLYFVLVINASTAPSQPVLDHQQPKLKYIKQSKEIAV